MLSNVAPFADGDEAAVDEDLRTRLQGGGAFAPLDCGNDGLWGHESYQKVGGVEAEMISQTSVPTLRKRCGVELEK